MQNCFDNINTPSNWGSYGACYVGTIFAVTALASVGTTSATAGIASMAFNAAIKGVGAGFIVGKGVECLHNLFQAEQRDLVVPAIPIVEGTFGNQPEASQAQQTAGSETNPLVIEL